MYMPLIMMTEKNNQSIVTIVKNLDYDQCILEFWTPNDPNSGWIHCSYNDAGNRKSIVTGKQIGRAHV